MIINRVKTWAIALSLCMTISPFFNSMPALAGSTEQGTVLLSAESENTASVTLNGVLFESGKTYVVPMALKNASDHSKDSAAAGCPGKYGLLCVNEDGTVTVTMTCRAVSVATITDYAYDFKIYQGTTTKSDTVDATVTALNENVSKTIDGEASYAPKTIQFDIPATCYDQDGVYISMFVDAMGSAPDAYLQFDYENAIESGDASVNYITDAATATVEAFGGYDVNAKVTVTDGVITDVDITGDNFNGDFADENQGYLQKALNGTPKLTGMKEKLIGLYENDVDAINGLDAVSGATYSSKAIKEAVLKALRLEVQEEVIPDAPEKTPDAGLYTITMTNITSVVDHSLSGSTNKSTAYLRVDDEGKMWLTYDVISGAKESPLYVLGYNGYYPSDDANAELTMDGVTLDTDTADVPTLGEKTIVTRVTVPLNSLSQTYTNNVYLYVDAMKALNGESAGILFDNGKFNIDTTVTLYWDTLKKVSTGETAISGLSDGVYKLSGNMVKVNQTDSSMSDSAINHNIMLTVKNGRYYITMNYNSMNVSGIKGYLKDLKYYDTGYTTDSSLNPSGTLKDVTVDSLQKYSDGSVYSDSLGTNYPNQVTFPLCREFVSGKTDYVPLQVFVPIMDAISAGTGTQDVYLKLDRSSVTKTTASDASFKETESPAVKQVKVSVGAMGKVKATVADYASVKLTWSKVSGAKGYEIQRYNTSTKKWTVLTRVTGTSYTNKKLATGTKYTYRVLAYCTSNGKYVYGKTSASVSAKPVLKQTTGVKVKNSAKRTAKISWTKVAGANGYVIYRSLKKSSGFKPVTSLKKGSAVSYTNKKLVKKKTYYYKVRAYRTVNSKKVYGAYSTVKSVKIKK